MKPGSATTKLGYDEIHPRESEGAQGDPYEGKTKGEKNPNRKDNPMCQRTGGSSNGEEGREKRIKTGRGNITSTEGYHLSINAPDGNTLTINQRNDIMEPRSVSEVGTGNGIGGHNLRNGEQGIQT